MKEETASPVVRMGGSAMAIVIHHRMTVLMTFTIITTNTN